MQRLARAPKRYRIYTVRVRFHEPRSLVVGLIGRRHWSAIVAYRGSSVRIISVRRSRVEEVALYESE